MTSASTYDILIPQIPSEFTTNCHVIPGFQEKLVGVGPMCDANCTVTFTKHAVNIYIPTGTLIMTGWLETTGHSLWRMSIMPNPLDINPLPDHHKTTTLQDFSAYDLPSVGALIRYFHETAGFLVCDTWVKAIKVGNFTLCPGTTYHNAANACPITYKTFKGHMVQVRQGIRSTKPKTNRKKYKQP